MSGGLLTTGFELKPLDEILDEIKTYQLTNISPTLNLQADSVLGVVDAIVASKLSDLWELGQAIYSASYPDSAAGVSLDNISALAGVTRLTATKSTVTVRLSGVNGTVIPSGVVVSVVTAGDRFASTAGGVIAGGILDLPFESEETGPIIANAGTLTVIETPIGGWASVTNLADALPGNNIETDEEFRVRRIGALSIQGDATLEAIRSEVLAVAGVSQCYVFENDTDATSADGIPPHALEVTVSGGVDQDIRDAIFASKACGIQAYGTTSGSVTDSQGFTHDVDFSRPVDVQIQANIVLSVDPVVFPPDGYTTIQAEIVAYVNAFLIGQDVIRNKFFDIVFNTQGVLDVTTLEIGLFPGALATSNLVMTARQIAKTMTAQIAVA